MTGAQLAALAERQATGRYGPAEALTVATAAHDAGFADALTGAPSPAPCGLLARVLPAGPRQLTAGERGALRGLATLAYAGGRRAGRPGNNRR